MSTVAAAPASATITPLRPDEAGADAGDGLDAAVIAGVVARTDGLAGDAAALS